METKQCDEITEMVCLESDLQDGQMKEVEVDQNKILLVRNNGEFTAVGGLCTHYGAHLSKVRWLEIEFVAHFMGRVSILKLEILKNFLDWIVCLNTKSKLRAVKFM